MNAFQVIWQFRTANFRVTLETAPEDTPPEDCFEFAEDARAVRSGAVAWFKARVAVYDRYNTELAAEYLGACAYRSVFDFRTDGGYFRDMVREAVSEARARCAGLQSLKLRSPC